MHRVYLIPGFFGFANLGYSHYFNHLYDLLASLFTGLQGQNLLRLLSLATLYMLRFGQLPLGAAEADHLDVIGHFGDGGHTPQHVDWLASGSAFDHRRFEGLWDEAVDFMLNAE